MLVLDKAQEDYDKAANTFAPLIANSTDDEARLERDQMIDKFINITYMQNQWAYNNLDIDTTKQSGMHKVLMSYFYQEQLGCVGINGEGDISDNTLVDAANRDKVKGLNSFEGQKLFEDSVESGSWVDYIFDGGTNLASDLRVASIYYNKETKLLKNSETKVGYEKKDSTYYNPLIDENSISPFANLISLKNDAKIEYNSEMVSFMTDYLKYCNTVNEYMTEISFFSGTYWSYVTLKKKWEKAKNQVKHGNWLEKIEGSAKLVGLAIPYGAVKGLVKSFVTKVDDYIRKINNFYGDALKNYSNLIKKLNDLQGKKVALLEAKASLAELTQVQSFSDSANAGVYTYYNPKTGKTESKQLKSLVDVYADIAVIKGVYAGDVRSQVLNDLKYVVQGAGESNPMSIVINGEDRFNIESLAQDTTTYDVNGYESGKVKAYNSGYVLKNYYNFADDERYDSLKKYLDYSESLSSKGIDSVIVKRKQETYFYNLMTQTANIGRAYDGYKISALDYFSVIEGFSADQIGELRKIKENPQALAAKMREYSASSQGLNDIELAQRKSIQEEEWAIKKKELLDKKKQWNSTVTNIFARGTKQWTNMSDSFMQRWNNWRSDMTRAVATGQSEWQSREEETESRKQRWLKNAADASTRGAAMKELTYITSETDEMIDSMQGKYGDLFSTIDVSSILKEVMINQPDLISDDLMKAMDNADTNFAITAMSRRDVNNNSANDFSKLMDDYDKSLTATKNIRLMASMKELLKQFGEEIKKANSMYAKNAKEYAEGYEFYLKDGKYSKSLLGYDYTVKKYNDKKFNQNSVMSDSEYNKAIDQMETGTKEHGDWYGEAFATMQMTLMEHRFKNTMEDIKEYTGDFGETKPEEDGKTFKVKKEKGEYGRIAEDIASKQSDYMKLQGKIDITKKIATSIAVGVASYFTFGAAGIAYAALESAQAVNRGVMTIGNAIKNVAVSAVGSVLGGVGNTFATLAGAGVRAGGGMINIDKKGNFDMVNTKQAYAGAGFAMAGGLFAVAQTTDVFGGLSGLQQSVLKNTVGFTTNTLQSSLKFNSKGGFSGFDYKSGLAGGSISFGAGKLADSIMPVNNDSTFGAQMGSMQLNRTLTNTLTNAGNMLYQSSTSINMGRHMQSQMTLTTEDYASASATKLKQNLDKADQENRRSEGRSTPLLDLMDSVIGAAGVGMKWAKDTASSALSAVKDGAIGLGKTVAQGAVKLGNSLSAGTSTLVGAVVGVGESIGNYATGNGFNTNKEVLQNNLAAAVADLEDNFSSDKRAVTNSKLANVKAIAEQLGLDTSAVEADIRNKQGAVDDEWADRANAKNEAEQLATGNNKDSKLKKSKSIIEQRREKEIYKRHNYIKNDSPNGNYTEPLSGNKYNLDERPVWLTSDDDIKAWEKAGQYDQKLEKTNDGARADIIKSYEKAYERVKRAELYGNFDYNDNVYSNNNPQGMLSDKDQTDRIDHLHYGNSIKWDEKNKPISVKYKVHYDIYDPVSTDLFNHLKVDYNYKNLGEEKKEERERQKEKNKKEATINVTM